MKLLFFLTYSLSGFFNLSCNSNHPIKTTTISANDSALIADAYQQALFVIKTSEEAITRGTSVKTKEFAEKILVEYSGLKGEFEELSGRKILKLPLDINNSQLIQWRHLVVNKSWEFDKNYIEVIERSNIGVKALLDNLRKHGEDQEAKKIAVKFESLGKANNELAFEVRQQIVARIKRDSVDQGVSFSK